MPSLAFPELTISIKRDGALVARDEATSDESLPDEMIRDEELLEMIRVFRNWLSQPLLIEKLPPIVERITDTEELALLGKLLYRLLFRTKNSNIAPFFKKITDKVPKGQRLRLQLRFDEEVADLGSLPWEYLYDPSANQFLVTRVDLVLSRYIQHGPRGTMNPDPGPLRILLVVSKPADESTIADKEVTEAILEFAAKEPGRIEVSRLDNPSVDSLTEHLRTAADEGRPPHVLHWIGHGRYSKSNRKGQIAFVNAANKKADWKDDAQFVGPFQTSGCVPRLVFLHLCEGAVIEKAEFLSSFAGLAPRLISSDVQAVVAMQFPIRNRDAKSFSRGFYADLARGKSVDEAVQTARRMLFSSCAAACGTPVLYLRSYDGIILPPGEQLKQGAAAGSGAGVASGQQTIPAGAAPGQEDAKSGASSGGPSTETPLVRVLDAGAKKIGEMSDRRRRMEMRARLYSEFKSELAGKTVGEMNERLAERWKSEADPEFKDVISEMADAVGRVS